MFRTRASKIDPALIAAAHGREPSRERGAGVGSMIPPGELPRALANVPAEARAGYRAPKEKPYLHDGGLLDSNGVVNCGRAVTLSPSGVVGQRGPTVRLLELSGLSKEAQTATLFLGALPTTPSANALTVGYGSWPVVATVKFAVGGGTFTDFEFDVPLATGEGISNLNLISYPTGKQPRYPSRGVVLTVPASSVIVEARLDSYTRSTYGEINSGGGGIDRAVCPNSIRDLPMNVYAYAGYNFSGKGSQNVFRTVVLYGTRDTWAVAAPFVVGAGITFVIPPFTRRIFLRGGTASALTVTLESPALGSFSTFGIPAGAITPFDVMPHETICTVANSGPNDIVTLFASCELSL